jgi:SAM-dependent methyltransferase
MGIDCRFTQYMAKRFVGCTVLETCSGGGFTTVALARVAKHVISVEIDSVHQLQAQHNVERAGLSGRVTFVNADILGEGILKECQPFDAAFLDPDWAVEGPEHEYRFRNSNTRPPADELLQKVLDLTPNAALVLPPFVDTQEFGELREHECQSLFLANEHELYCLYFGALAHSFGRTEIRR